MRWCVKSAWLSWVWWSIPVIPVFRMLRQKDREIKVRLGYIVGPCLKRTEKVPSISEHGSNLSLSSWYKLVTNILSLSLPFLLFFLFLFLRDGEEVDSCSFSRQLIQSSNWCRHSGPK
jgi:hypothetical protein